ncbi:MAG TPA: TolC family protein, partial [candidate division Zixibacteria bacterium]|nr:TolC family protein [candidate division Zixibacteria bacterium]
WRAEVAAVGHVGALPDPRVSVGYFLESIETRVGPQEARFGVSQTIPWPGGLSARKRVSSLGAEAAFERLQSARLALNAQVKRVHFERVLLERRIELTRENMELVRYWESVARARYQVALSAHPDVLRAQVELGSLENQLASLEARREPLESRMRSLCNLPAAVSLGAPRDTAVNLVEVELESITSAALAHNPELAEAERMIGGADAGVAVARNAARPDFTVGVDYIQTGPAVNPAMAMFDSGKDPWMIHATLSLPLWFGKNAARTREAQARLRGAEAMRDDRENRLRADISARVIDYQNAVRELKLYEGGLIPKAQQSVNASFAAYQSAKLSFADLLAAQRQALSFELALAEARAAAAIGLAQLEALVGAPLE